MSREESSYGLLIEKLDQFIRKYYLNQMIRGLLYSIGLIVLCFLLFASIEHFFFFGTAVRKILFYSFIAISAVALCFWIGLPLFKYFRLGTIISHEQAAVIIGNHFGNVRDKLINILQLNRQMDEVASKSLIRASIDQKTRQIQPVPFQSAIDLGKNKKYLPFALPPLLLLLGLLIGAPSLIKDPANRIIRNNQEFERDAPFQFVLVNPSLEVPQYEDFNLDIALEGDYLPEQAFIVVNGFQYRLKKKDVANYSYTFNNVQQDQKFSFFAEGVSSKAHDLRVLKKPNILDFSTDLDYPAYLGRKDEQVSNIGDLVVPAGTKIDWVVESVNTDHLWFELEGADLKEADRIGDDTYTFNKRLYSNLAYKMVIGNDDLPKGDSVSYVISVVPDLYPSVSLKQFNDSTHQKLQYLVGEASDDYGLSRITFNYDVVNQGKKVSELTTIELEKPLTKNTSFDHIFNIEDLELRPGDEVNYYFEVWDNDGVHGAKSSRSSLLKYSQPSVEEFQEKEDANEEDIKNTLDAAQREAEKIKEEFKALREKMLQEKSVDWQLKKELEDLLDRQKNLENELDNAKNKFEENLKNQPEFSQIDEETQEKQEKLRELFEKLADEETKELMEKIQKLMEELKKDDALQMIENMEFNEEELSMELDRLKELFKQLELERDLKREIEKLEELGKKQEELGEETAKDESGEEHEEKGNEQEEEKGDEEDGNQGEERQEEEKVANEQDDEGKEGSEEENAKNDQGNEKSAEEKQEEMNESFEEIKKELEELVKKNEELQSPKNIDDQGEQLEDIQQDMDKSIEQLQQNQKKDASKSQKNAGQKMQQAAQQMQQQMQDGEMEQMQEDMQAMRQLLENLIGLSFEQEQTISDFNKTHTSTPKYKTLVQQQHKLKDDFHLIEDSLQALSQRVFQIESFVLEKVADINKHMDRSLKLLEDRKKAQASDDQQRTMKNVNDLALMFSESMDQMQQQMAGMMAGKQMCTKPGSGNPKDGQGNVPMDKISEGQKNLNGEMKKMREGMEKGAQEGTSKEFAQMAAKQAALRKALRDLQNEKQAQGQGSKELEQILEQMDKIETDLVNKRLTNEMLRRQQDILTRLLESERAEREREYEDKRESKSAEEQERKLPPSVEKYIKEREAQIEPFKTVSPSLKPYYKQLVEEYYKSLKDS